MATDAATLTIGIVVSVIAITLLVAIIYRCTWHTGSDDTQSHVHLLAGDKEGGDDDVRYTVQRKLGDGTYGTVYLAKRKSDGQLVAIKVVPCSSDRQSREALNEYQACQTLQGHPNVVKLLDMFEDVPMPSRKAGSIYGALGYSSTILTHLRIAVSKTSAVFVCTVHEYYPHGTLFDLLVKRRAGIKEELAWDYTKQLLSSVIFMHSNNLLHRDIKPSNILVSSDEQRLAVTDFGLARETALHEYAKTKIGTYHYMAPEQIEQQRYNAKADVWSVGCVTYALCTAKVATRDAVVMFMARKSPDFEDRFTKELLGLGYSLKLAQFIMKLLAEDPQRRPASDEALHLLKQLTEVPEAATATATTSAAVVP